MFHYSIKVNYNSKGDNIIIHKSEYNEKSIKYLEGRIVILNV